jgi:RNA polymerase sigma factor (sigma-70 family)
MGQSGGRWDAGALYRELAPAVLGYLRGQGVADPEDVLGEIFLQVARDVHRVKGDALDVRRWVFGVARNRVIDQARRASRRPVTAGGAVPERAGPEEAEPFDPALLAALATLTADQREVVVLRFVADLPLDAVATLTGRSAGAVKSLQHRGLAQLAQAVSPEVPTAL